MALQGTLDSFSLDEVLGMIAGSRKSGTLQVRGDRGVGAVYFNAGRACGAEAGRHTGPVADNEKALDARLQDVCFELFRFSEGNFIFEADRLPDWARAITLDIDIEFIVGEVKRRVVEWESIQAVIPSVEARPRLVSELPFEDVTVDRSQWRLLSVIDGRRRVNAIMRLLEASEFDTCRSLKGLKELELIEIEVPTDDSSSAPAHGEVRSPEPVAVAPEPVAVATEPVVVAPEPVVVAPEPVVVAPEPVVVAPEPVAVAPEPVAMASEPVSVLAPAAPVSVPAPESVFEVNLVDDLPIESRVERPASTIGGSLLEQGLEDIEPRRNGAAQPDPIISQSVQLAQSAQAEPDPDPEMTVSKTLQEVVTDGAAFDEAISELRTAALAASDIAEAPEPEPDDVPLEAPDQVENAPVDYSLRAAAAAELAGLGVDPASDNAGEEPRRRRGRFLSPVREA